MTIPTDHAKISGARKVNLRSEPRISAKSLDILDEGTVVNVDTNFSSSDFVKVITRRGKLGYVAKKFVTYV